MHQSFTDTLVKWFLPRDAAMLARSWESHFCPSVRLSVCLSHACFVTNPKNLPAIFLYHMKGNPSGFLVPKVSAKFQRGHP